jgi:hypothetical protein
MHRLTILDITVPITLYNRGYTAYPSYTYPYPYYYNYVYPSYAGSYYYSRPTAYNDPYVALRPYSDGAGPKAN